MKTENKIKELKKLTKLENPEAFAFKNKEIRKIAEEALVIINDLKGKLWKNTLKKDKL